MIVGGSRLFLNLREAYYINRETTTWQRSTTGVRGVRTRFKQFGANETMSELTGTFTVPDLGLTYVELDEFNTTTMVTSSCCWSLFFHAHQINSWLFVSELHALIFGTRTCDTKVRPDNCCISSELCADCIHYSIIVLYVGITNIITLPEPWKCLQRSNNVNIGRDDHVYEDTLSSRPGDLHVHRG